jgi:hypothetical protein
MLNIYKKKCIFTNFSYKRNPKFKFKMDEFIYFITKKLKKIQKFL